MEEAVTITCAACKAPKAPPMFTPYQVKRALKGLVARCRMCQRGYKRSVAIRGGTTWQNNHGLFVK